MKNLYLPSVALLAAVICMPGPRASGSVGGRGVGAVKLADVARPYSVPIEVGRHGHIYIEVKVDNVEGRFILDTGAGINVISSKFASKIHGLKEEDGYFTGFRATGEAMRLNLYKVDDIKIGNLIVRGPTVTVLNADLGDFDGLISVTSFRTRPFTIDFADKKLLLETGSSLEEREKAGKAVPIRLDDDRGISLDMFTDVRVNDRLTLLVSLDSGAGFNVYRFNSGFMTDLGLDTATAGKYIKKSSMNTGTKNTFYVDDLKSIALYSVPSIHTGKVKASFLSSLIYDGITGINWLGKRITIDIPDRKIILN